MAALIATRYPCKRAGDPDGVDRFGTRRLRIDITRVHNVSGEGPRSRDRIPGRARQFPFNCVHRSSSGSVRVRLMTYKRSRLDIVMAGVLGTGPQTGVRTG